MRGFPPPLELSRPLWYNTYSPRVGPAQPEVVIPSPILLDGGLSQAQYQWLKVRLGTSTDAESLRITGLSRETLRHWKKQPAFATVLSSIRTDRLYAFRLLCLSLSELALTAVENLLKSGKGSDQKAGVMLWKSIFRLGGPEDEEAVDLPGAVYNILNIRGDMSPELLKAINPHRQLPEGK